MGTKVFHTSKTGLELVSDDRDIALPYKVRQDFWNWCESNKIKVEHNGCGFDLDLWKIENEAHRAFAILRWS